MLKWYFSKSKWFYLFVCSLFVLVLIVHLISSKSEPYSADKKICSAVLAIDEQPREERRKKKRQRGMMRRTIGIFRCSYGVLTLCVCIFVIILSFLFCILTAVTFAQIDRLMLFMHIATHCGPIYFASGWLQNFVYVFQLIALANECSI